MNNVKIFKVGGAVRDSLLGVQSKDIDFAVEAPSFEAMRDHILANGTIYLEKPEYFTIRGKLNGVDADFVLCRKEHGYTDGRRPDLVTVGDIYDDLSRRDFTMNAIAIDVETGERIDPHGGQNDILHSVIRCVGSADQRFNEDSLRLLRAIRFAITKGFTLDNAIESCLNDWAVVSKLKNVSPERIREELNRCFKHNTFATWRKFEDFPILADTIFKIPGLKLEVTLNKN